jgi:hypothetical protein
MFIPISRTNFTSATPPEQMASELPPASAAVALADDELDLFALFNQSLSESQVRCRLISALS